MQQFHFRLDGFTEKDSRRWKKRTHPSSIFVNTLVWTAAIIAVIYAINHPGQIKINSPVSGTTIYNQVITVTGTVENPEVEAIILDVNRFSHTVSVENGKFTLEEVKLNLGKNTIQASVEGVASNFIGKSNLVAINHVELDEYSNPKGDKYDLVKDYFFKDLTIAVLHLYTGGGFDFKLPEEVLKKKGFKIHRWTHVPTAIELSNVLETACQLWVISSNTRKLNNSHLKEIKRFFDRGRGVYIWGDNEPYYADANYVANALLGVTMQNNTPGDQVIKLQTQSGVAGFIRHPITTGIESLYEGSTIATIERSSQLEPLIYGSAGNLAVAIYDKNGKRAVIDSGFTKLYYKWGTAGTERYIKNATAWLAKYERLEDLH